MYLIHVRLRSATPTLSLPTAGLLTRLLDGCGVVEHSVVHDIAPHHPVLGAYVLASDIEAAEQLAFDVCRRLIAEEPRLAGLRVESSEAAMVAPYYEALMHL